MYTMIRGRSGTSRWIGAALLVGLGVPASAQAVIPYEAEITPGALRGIAYAPGDPWLYGYWEYLPTSFDVDAGVLWPLLVFMAGVGEYDDISSCPSGTDLCTPADCGSDGLCRNLTWGPQMLMDNGQWNELTRPFVMVSPQHPVPPFSAGEWDVDILDDYIQFILDNYPIDPRRLYLIGMSQGGRGVLQFTQAYPRRFTAVAPTPGGIIANSDASCYFQDTALWVFHGEDDADGTLGAGVFSPCNMVDVAYQYSNPQLYPGSLQCAAIVGQPRPVGRLTMYYNVGHFAWVPTVDPIGVGFAGSAWLSDQGCGIPATFRDYDPALDADGVYSWFLSLDRPSVVAPDDLTIDMPATSLVATITDDDAVTIEWTQTSGPLATLSNADTDTLDISDLQESQQYTFQIHVLDADGQWDLDEVIVTTEVFPIAGSTGGSSSSGDASSSTGGAGETTDASGRTDVGESTGGASTGGASTGTSNTDGPGATTSTGGEAVDDTLGTGTGGPGGNATSAGPSTSASSESGDAGESPGESSGCGCRTEGGRSGGWLGWAVVLLAFRRRGRAIVTPRCST
jgi:MYXO-CTERM domain-containing protein